MRTREKIIFVLFLVFVLLNASETNDLVVAIKNKNLPKIKNLINKGFDVNYRDEEGITPLIRVMKKNLQDSTNFKIINILVDNGSNVNAKGNYGTSPLMYAVAKENIEIVKYLIQNGANVNAKDNGGDTPLTFAIAAENIEIVKYLIQNGANIHIRNNFPIYLAKSHDNQKLINILKESNNIKRKQDNALNNRSNNNIKSKLTEIFKGTGNKKTRIFQMEGNSKIKYKATQNAFGWSMLVVNLYKSNGESVTNIINDKNTNGALNGSTHCYETGSFYMQVIAHSDNWEITIEN